MKTSTAKTISRSSSQVVVMRLVFSEAAQAKLIASQTANFCAREAVHSAMVRDERLIGQVM